MELNDGLKKAHIGQGGQSVAYATTGRTLDSAGIMSAVGTSRSATQSKHSQPPAPTKPVHTDSEAQSVGAGGDRRTGRGRTWGEGWGLAGTGVAVE